MSSQVEVQVMPSFEVRQRGVDTSGRPILATDYFWRVWCAVLDRPRVQPFASKIVVVQGAFMARLGGGAASSAGYHDQAGCWDVRTWNLTPEEQRILWWEAALFAIFFWPRDAARGGMDPHGHGIAGWDRPLATGAAYQWQQAKNGRDGLAGNGPDYIKPRPEWVDTPPPHLLQEDYMATSAAEKKLDEILVGQRQLAASLGDLSDAEKQRFVRERDRDKAVRAKLYDLLGGLADQLTEIGNDLDTNDTALKAKIANARSQILSALAADPDVDGKDNPAPQG